MTQQHELLRRIFGNANPQLLQFTEQELHKIDMLLLIESVKLCQLLDERMEMSDQIKKELKRRKEVKK